MNLNKINTDEIIYDYNFEKSDLRCFFIDLAHDMVDSLKNDYDLPDDEKLEEFFQEIEYEFLYSCQPVYYTDIIKYANDVSFVRAATEIINCQGVNLKDYLKDDDSFTDIMTIFSVLWNALLSDLYYKIVNEILRSDDDDNS